MKNSIKTVVALLLIQGAHAQSAYVADYAANPFTDGSATNLDGSSWVSSAYGRNGAVVSNPSGEDDEEAFFSINPSFYSNSVNNIGDTLTLSTSFYSDSTTGSGAKESAVYISLAPGVTAMLGDIGDGSGNEQILLGIGANAAVVTNPGFALTTDQWVNVLFSAEYAGNTSEGNATFDYTLTLSGGMTGIYTANGVVQPSHSYYDIVGSPQSPQFGQEGDGDAQTIYWAAPATATVPEPSSLFLLGLGSFLGIIFRRR
ncbi:MAG: PEP-CTERM sorting domain-containing protein [Akkermansiaceae bacterium]